MGSAVCGFINLKLGSSAYRLKKPYNITGWSMNTQQYLKLYKQKKKGNQGIVANVLILLHEVLFSYSNNSIIWNCFAHEPKQGN
jgi:hypothetical protein